MAPATRSGGRRVGGAGSGPAGGGGGTGSGGVGGTPAGSGGVGGASKGGGGKKPAAGKQNKTTVQMPSYMIAVAIFVAGLILWRTWVTVKMGQSDGSRDW